MPDDQLIACVSTLAAREKRSSAALIAALAELEKRKLYRAEGYASLFAYCRQALHLSEDAAYNRMRAARVAARWPSVIERIADGSLTMTALRLLADVLTDENHELLLQQAMHKSRQEIEALVATLAPRDPHSWSIRQVGPDRYEIEMTVDRDTHRRLRELQNLLRHQIPDGDPAQIVGRALKLLLEDVLRRRFAAVRRPGRPQPAARVSRHVPAAIRRQVWERDGGRCAFVGNAGRCSERGFLEIHHVVPFARGGPMTVENLQLRCRAHNVYEAEAAFGPFLVRERQPAYGSATAQ